jgi:Zn-finger nucleic acid-binding protein
MQSISVGTLTLLDCVSCDGLWVDAETFERICADKEAQAAVLHGRPSSPPAIESRVSYRPCVRCGTMMNRVNFARLSGTIVDVCKGHGTFLDRGELQAIVTFIQGGGLERARARQIEELREQERRLKEQAARLANTSYKGGALEGGYFGSGSGLSFDGLISFLHES